MKRGDVNDRGWIWTGSHFQSPEATQIQIRERRRNAQRHVIAKRLFPNTQPKSSHDFCRRYFSLEQQAIIEEERRRLYPADASILSENSWKYASRKDCSRIAESLHKKFMKRSNG